MLATLAILASIGSIDPADLEFFEKNVRPILVERCQKCHGPEKQKGDLRLDSRAGALAGGKGGPAVVPGKIDESPLVDAINYGDLLQMPPKSKLPEAEIAVLTDWVKRGAPWPEEAAKPPAEASGPKVKPFNLEERAKHWSFQPIRRVDPPTVKDGAWPLGPIDRFLLADLEAKGLKPAPPADKATLIRRATFDLIGLPPSPEEVRQFLADDSPDAFATVVDRLLASPHYGERWGRHWLDLVRFAETYGHEFDYEIPDAWKYRDYVVRALNADLPYDQFLTEQVAGDLLPNPRRNPEDGTNESLLATGFYLLGEGTHSPVDVRDDEVLRLDNEIDVLSKTFLGLTVSCARCHDHKFDPIRQRDYYSLAGFVRSTRYQHAFLDPPGRIEGKASELEALKREIVSATRPKLPKAGALAYLKASREALSPTSPLDDPADVLFEDFESESYAEKGWKADGPAFGAGPIRLPVPDYQGDVASKGRGLVGSHNGRVVGSVTDRDYLTGTLVSPEFPIKQDYIHFLIGGGSHAGKTCVNLVVDGKPVLSATGHDDNRMSPHAFDARPWRGRSARIEVVDRDPGPWGNISLDHVVFSDRAEPPDSLERRVSAVARRMGLEEPALGRWTRWARSWPQSTDPGATPNGEAFEEFDGPTYANWFVSGQAFGPGPSPVGASRVSASGVVPETPGVAHSGLVSNRLQGVLRSRTFRITKKAIALLAWGESGRINVVVDGFEKIRDPIYGGLTRAVNTTGPAWHVLDVSMWIGHDAFLELADGAAADFSGGGTRMLPGDGYLAVDRIVFADFGPLPPPPPAPSTTDESLADEMASALADWNHGRLGSGPSGPARTTLVASMMANGLLESPATVAPLLSRYRAIEAAIPSPTIGLAVCDGTGQDERILIRGNSKTPGDVAPRRFLEVLAGTDQPAPASGSGRLELARRMLAPSNPLTPRVIVNRLWKGHFGEGLVKTPDDFGLMGQPPSHPALLDWLASEVVRRGWSLKAMHREIMLSRAYQMSSRLDPEGERLDPGNRSWHRMNVRRLEAEAVRDAMLSASGRLDPKLGGPSVAPHLTPFMDGRGRPGHSGPLDGDGRRSLYLNVRRNFLSPMLLAFDFPAPASTMGRRNVSNVPAQALTLLNDPFVAAQAKLWAKKTMGGRTRSPSERLDDVYETAFARKPTAEERAEALEFLGDRADDPSAWADLCHVLFNVKEFVFIP